MVSGISVLLLLLLEAVSTGGSVAGQDRTGAYPFCLVTHFTENGFHYGEIAAQNHASYAQLHGYGQQAFVGRLSGADFVDSTQGGLDDLWGGGLFWQKLVAIRQVLEDGTVTPEGGTRACDWVMWLDSDAIVTNPDIDLGLLLAPFVDEPVFQRFGHINKVVPADIVLSVERDHPINSGVFFVRNTAVGHALINALLALYPMYQDNNLPDQTALGTLAYLSEPWPSSSAVSGVQPHLHPSVRLAPQRTFNAFYSSERQWAPDVQWQPGDFVAHLAGTPWNRREQTMRELLAPHP